MIIERILV